MQTAMHAIFLAVTLGPLAIACIFFLLSGYCGMRMLWNLRPDREWLAALSAPWALFSERFYTEQGRVFHRRFQRFFRLFALWLLGW